MREAIGVESSFLAPRACAREADPARQLARNIRDADEDRGRWAGILAGADVFERG